MIGESCETNCTLGSNNVKTTCLIDSGSVVTTIQKHFYDSHLSSLYPLHHLANSSLRIEGANGQSVLYEGYISIPISLPEEIVGIGSPVNVLAIIVTCRVSCPSPVIVGTNHFRSLATACRAHLGPKFISLLDIPTSIYACYQKAAYEVRMGDPTTGKVGQVRCRLRRPLTIEPDQALQVVGTLYSSLPPGKHNVLVQEVENPHRNQDIHVVNAIQEVFGRRAKVKVSISNNTNVPITVHNRQVIAEAFTYMWDRPLAQVCANVTGLMTKDYDFDSVGLTVPCYFTSSPQKVDEDDDSLGNYDIASDTSQVVADSLTKQLDQIDGLFAKDDNDYGCAKGVEHVIKLTDKTPWNARARPIPQNMYEEARQLFQGLLDAELIRPSTSAYSSPVCLVRKKSGKLRMTVDYRQPNRRVTPDAYSIPKVEDLFNSLHGSKFFTVVDLKGAFFQIPLREEDRQFSAFNTPFGLYEFTRMPQGLKSSPAQMQRVVERCLGDCSLREAIAYIDDIVIHAPTMEGCIERTLKALTRVRDFGLKLEKKKCHFLYQTVSHLGHEISGKGIRPCPSKIEDVLEWHRPNNVQQLRQWLGFCGYYRRFCKDFSKICRPLNDLLVGLSMPRRSSSTPADRSKVRRAQLEPFREKWTDRCEDAFLALKRLLTTAPVLGFADLSKPFELHCDASGFGLGAVLYQEQDNVKRVITYASRGLSQTERNYCAWKREFLCLKWAVTEKFADYLYGEKFIVITDNNPLTYVMTNAKLDATGQRWVANLSVFDFEIRYCPGKNLNDADSLSRRPGLVPDDNQIQEEVSTQVEFLKSRVQQMDTAEVSALFQGYVQQPANETGEIQGKHTPKYPSQPPPVVIATSLAMQPSSIPDPYTNSLQGNTSLPGLSNTDWHQLQMDDLDIGKVRTFIESGSHPSPKDRKEASTHLRVLFREMKRFVLHKSVLYRQTKDPLSGEVRLQLVIPHSFIGQAMRGIHDDCGHLGFDKCASLAKTRFYFPFMASTIKKWIDQCDRCIKRKRKQEREEMGTIVTTQPLELLCLDYLSIEPDNGGVENVLVMTDHFSRYSVAVPTKDQRSSTVAKALWENFIVHYGWPAKILTDQAQDFNSKLIKELCSMAGVEKVRTTPYHPQANPVERFNRVLLDMLGCLSDKGKSEWRKHVSPLVHAYNVCEHDTTHFSPYFLMFGRNARLPIDLAFGIDPQWSSEKDKTIYVKNLREQLKEAYDIASRNMANRSSANKKQYDLKAKAPVLEVGDRVLVKNVHLRGKHKLANRWGDNVYVILHKIGESPVYRVQKEGSTDTPRVLHRNLLLPYDGPDNDRPHVPDLPTTKPPVTRQRQSTPRTRNTANTVISEEEDEDNDGDIFIIPNESVPIEHTSDPIPSLVENDIDPPDQRTDLAIDINHHDDNHDDRHEHVRNVNDITQNNHFNNRDNAVEGGNNQTVAQSDAVDNGVNVDVEVDVHDSSDADRADAGVDENVKVRKSTRNTKGVGPSRLTYDQPGKQSDGDFKLALAQQMRAFLNDLL